MASKKVSTLNALTSAGDDDLLYIADTSDSGASYASKRITVQNFLNGTASATALTTEEGARAAADAALSGRLDVLEADPTTATALSAEIAARTSGDSALSGRLDTLEADPTTQTLLDAETTARTNADTALSGRLDTLEADPTTGAALTAETNARISADSALSGRLDTLEADPTTQTLLTAETTARTNADTALSGRLDTLEADPTTQTLLDAETAARTSALTAETNARTSADTALSGRLDALEADPTTQTLLDAETAARIAADALLLPLAGGTMSGAINLGASSGGTGVEYSALSASSFEQVSFFNETVTFTDEASGIRVQRGAADGFVARLPFTPTLGETNTISWTIEGDTTGTVKGNIVRVPDGVDASESTWVSQYNIPDHLDTLGGSRNGAENLKISGVTEQSGSFVFTPTEAGDYFVYFRFTGGGSGSSFVVSNLGITPVSSGSAASVLGVDGSATFGGNITASAVPSDNAHLVNKLYADNLVAGVDLSGIATNAAAIEALTNGAPELLNTLNELAAAIGDDENFSTTITNQIASETTARTNADTALSGRLDTLEADPTTGAALTAETNARTSADTALSNRLDTLEADPTTQTLLTAETTARTNADNALSGRLDTLEADPTTATALTAETTARTNADNALSGRLDTLEADPTTQTLLTAETTARTNADNALSGRLDTLEADPTTATALTNAVAAETAARQAADALLLPLAGGTMSGAINLGVAAPAEQIVSTTTNSPGDKWLRKGATTEPITKIVFSGIDPAQPWGINKFQDNAGVNFTDSSVWTVTVSYGDFAAGNGIAALFDGNVGTFIAPADSTATITLVPNTPLDGANIDANIFLHGHTGNEKVEFYVAAAGGGGGASVLGVDGTASFSGNISASAVPSDDAHLVNKLYADSLVAGVDLSGIATNAAAISAETTARTNADAALSGRLDTLEADPTTGSALSAEATTRANADTALSGRLDTLEADPTTATAVTNAIAVETAARIAGDALKLDLSGGDLTGALNVGSGSVSTTYASNAVVGSGNVAYPPLSFFDGDLANYGVRFQKGGSDIFDPTIEFNGLTASTSVRLYIVDMSSSGYNPYLTINGIQTEQTDYNQSARFAGGPGWVDVSSFLTFPITVTKVGTTGPGADFKYVDIRAIEIDGQLITEGGTITTPGGAASTLNTDGSATFGGNVTASTAPTADAHLVNKLYADNLVAGVDLSGIAANAAAIQALTNGAPELLNTLQELAAALGDDANFSTTITGQISANEVHIDNMVNLTGVVKDSTHLGAFTGSTIGTSSSIKTALQALETAVETPSTASQIQTVEQNANGTFHVTFVDSNNNAATAESLFTDSGLTYNPFTDLLSGGSVDMTKFFFNGVEVTSTGTELNYLGGVTSSVQTQIDSKVSTGANINALVGDTTAGSVPVDVNGADNYLFLVIDKANGSLTAIDKTFLEAE